MDSFAAIHNLAPNITQKTVGKNQHGNTQQWTMSPMPSYRFGTYCKTPHLYLIFGWKRGERPWTSLVHTKDKSKATDARSCSKAVGIQWRKHTQRNTITRMCRYRLYMFFCPRCSRRYREIAVFPVMLFPLTWIAQARGRVAWCSISRGVCLSDRCKQRTCLLHSPIQETRDASWNNKKRILPSSSYYKCKSISWMNESSRWEEWVKPWLIAEVRMKKGVTRRPILPIQPQGKRRSNQNGLITNKIQNKSKSQSINLNRS